MRTLWNVCYVLIFLGPLYLKSKRKLQWLAVQSDYNSGDSRP